VLKIVSPDAIHKTEVGGVLTGIGSQQEVINGYALIRDNLERYQPGAGMTGIRVAAMAPEGYDMFIGGLQDPSFGPVVFFGFGGIYVEVFKDVERVLCPSSLPEIRGKLERLKVRRMLAGLRGRRSIDPEPFIGRSARLPDCWPIVRKSSNWTSTRCGSWPTARSWPWMPGCACRRILPQERG
jgi:acetate---CoA ligase (ADP-forming)